ncbi:Nif3-like dinuclear metal center hexameric protein [Chlamydiifrater phoenicopteri]|uniref:Nif3-like dinuclear metal center hexameric protein n=1 Tax=Chlamydiifrater phoenicopteri TaxID=2681469 RepID=UPI001BCDF18A|nr:Nif3-like dinuclear metal center hexameric protein [Chlamydiifrater phoenicopteri]
MLVKELLDVLDSLLSPHLFKDCCPNGLQVGKEDSHVGRVATAVTADLKTIQLAAEKDVQTLIVHHGIFWPGLKTLTGHLFARTQALISQNINLLAYHLPLDAHPTLGNNAGAARTLGWEQIKPFGPPALNVGYSGRFPPVSVEEFQQTLSSYYGAPLAYVHAGKPIVSSAALISGSAYKEISLAAKEGFDCFITGTFDEPAWSLAHEEHINFFAFGHTNTERVGVKMLATYLQEELSLPTEFLNTDNPF